MHHTQMSSFGDCALGLAPALSTMAREGAFRRQRRLNREHPICTERMSRSQ